MLSGSIFKSFRANRSATQIYLHILVSKYLSVAELSVGIIKKGVFGGDLDTLGEEGLYRMRDSISNAPEGGFYDAPIFVFRSLSVLTQVVFLPAKNSISMRSKINSSWSSWKEL